MIVHPLFTEVRCNGCGRQTTNFVPSSPDSAAVARDKARHGGWRSYRRKNAIYDKCPKCLPPQEEGWRIVT